jgi:hypothetical protein
MKGPIRTCDLSCDKCECLRKDEYYDYEDGHKEYWIEWHCQHPNLSDAMKTERILKSTIDGFTTTTPNWCPELS